MPARKILIADDDPALLKSLSIRLRAAGYETICTQDGYQAVATARSEWPDLLLLDINMPAGSGFSVQKRVWKMVHLNRIPVIYLTGDRSKRMADAAVQLGAYAILQKPFETDELLALIESALQRDLDDEQGPAGTHSADERQTTEI